VSGDFEHCAHVDVGVGFDDEDASVEVLELAALSAGVSVESVMVVYFALKCTRILLLVLGICYGAIR
jgi:hypothetical protein